MEGTARMLRLPAGARGSPRFRGGVVYTPLPVGLAGMPPHPVGAMWMPPHPVGAAWISLFPGGLGDNPPSH